jgi:hypothetical protein
MFGFKYLSCSKCNHRFIAAGLEETPLRDLFWATKHDCTAFDVELLYNIEVGHPRYREACDLLRTCAAAGSEEATGLVWYILVLKESTLIKKERMWFRSFGNKSPAHLPLDEDTSTRLAKAGIRTIYGLVRHSPLSLGKLSGIGPATVRKVAAALAYHGIKFVDA